MPIRVIAFDSMGSDLRLIGRDEMFRRILSEIVVQEDFNLTEIHETDSWEAHIRKTKFIGDIVERNARYAILSHTWIRDTPGDVVYQDWEDRTSNPRGYSKIAKFCEVAARDHGVTMGWIDSVCINKESSSELDESIRSMYKWYQMAHVCVAFLSQSQAHVLDDIHKDVWFTRGWTLQELLAPKHIDYYDSEWVSILRQGGSTLLDMPFFPKDLLLNTIQQQVQKATKIKEHELNLCRAGKVDRIPASRIMQLASTREVLREEDTAYSLMGLLGVGMPVAYGEGGQHALFRLIRELLNSSTRNVLDIFNHGYRSFSRKLIPTSIAQYNDRSTAFDVPGRGMASLLDQCKPIESITMSHLGVRVPLLLVPGLAITEHNYKPYKDLSGVIDLGIHSSFSAFSDIRYFLLDRLIYTDQAAGAADSLWGDRNKSGPLIVTFGVLNFGMEGDNIVIPENCLSVALDCGAVSAGDVDSTTSVKIIATSKAPVFRLKSATQSTIPKAGLRDQGLQLVVLNLQ